VFVAVVLESLATLAALIKRQPQQKQAGKKDTQRIPKSSTYIHVHKFSS